MATMNVLNSVGGTESVEKPLAPGRAAAASSRPVALSTEDFAVIDGIETLITATNAAIATTNSSLSTIDGRVDGLETLVTATNTAIGVTNTSLTTIDGRVDTLETLIASTNTKLDTAITALQIIDNMTLAASTANIGDVDVLTINGVAPAFGSGAVGATVQRVAMATDSPGVITLGTAGAASTQVMTVQGIASGTPQAVSGTVSLTDISNGEYETVAASQTAQALGATGATGDFISGILVIPATTSPGVVTLLDNATSIPVFVGGASSVSNLVPFFIPLGIKSVSGAWKITTGANVSCIGIGNFT